MSRITYTVEIAGVSDASAMEFIARLREMPQVVDVEQLNVGLDWPGFQTLVVFPKPISTHENEPNGYVIGYWDEEDRPHPHPLLWSADAQEHYETYFNYCMGKLDPTQLGSEQLSDFSNLCFFWVRLCLRELGCNDFGKFATLEEALETLPKLNWALRNPGKPLSEYSCKQ